MNVPDVAQRENVGLAFSGGGSRSFSATLGYLRGLHDLKLLDRVRYIGGISGGSWAASAYTYAQLNTPNVAASDEELLGDIVSPQNLSLDALSKIPATCARLSATKNLVAYVTKNLLRYKDHEAWARSISQMYLEPQGVDPDAFFTLNSDSEASIKSRNPALAESAFVSPIVSRPYMILGATLVGPNNISVLSSKNMSFTLIENTPLYVGEPNVQNVTYTSGGILLPGTHQHPGAPRAAHKASQVKAASQRDTDVPTAGKGKTVTECIGGYMEPFAVGSTPLVPVVAEGHTSARTPMGSVNVTLPPTPFRLMDAVGASSFFAGGVTSTFFPASVAAGLEPVCTYAWCMY